MSLKKLPSVKHSSSLSSPNPCSVGSGECCLQQASPAATQLPQDICQQGPKITKSPSEAFFPPWDIWEWEAAPTVLEMPAGFAMGWYKGQAAVHSAPPPVCRSTSSELGIAFSQSPGSHSARPC